jgi:TctA family transporter
MLTKHLDLSLTLILIVAVANVIAAGICFYLAPHLAIIARIPGRVVVPLTLAVIFVGSFAFQGFFGDVIVLVIFSVIGVAGQKLGYNLGGLFIGYILGDLFENYLFVSLQIGGPLFFLTPISLFLILLLIVFFAYTPLKNGFKKKRGVSRG